MTSLVASFCPAKYNTSIINNRPLNVELRYDATQYLYVVHTNQN